MPEPIVITKLSSEPIDTMVLIDAVAVPHCGAVVSFEGRIRNHNNGNEVQSLFYEAFEERATKQLDQLAREAVARFGLGGVVAVHRTGTVVLGDIAVLVATSSPHRPAAFDATRWLIDEIKSNVAIWKKEIYTDGSAWVGTDGTC